MCHDSHCYNYRTYAAYVIHHGKHTGILQCRKQRFGYGNCKRRNTGLHVHMDTSRRFINNSHRSYCRQLYGNDQRHQQLYNDKHGKHHATDSAFCNNIPDQCELLRRKQRNGRSYSYRRCITLHVFLEPRRTNDAERNRPDCRIIHGYRNGCKRLYNHCFRYTHAADTTYRNGYRSEYYLRTT